MKICSMGSTAARPCSNLHGSIGGVAAALRINAWHGKASQLAQPPKGEGVMEGAPCGSTTWLTMIGVT